MLRNIIPIACLQREHRKSAYQHWYCYFIFSKGRLKSCFFTVWVMGFTVHDGENIKRNLKFCN